jgi:hypothetical protein
MTSFAIGRRALLCGAAVSALALPALAHHGWGWAVDEQSELKGTIRAISMAPPHPTLQVAATDGVLWQIDLGNPARPHGPILPATQRRSATPSPCSATGIRTPAKGR